MPQDLPRSSTGTSANAKWLDQLKEIAPRVMQTHRCADEQARRRSGEGDPPRSVPVGLATRGIPSARCALRAATRPSRHQATASPSRSRRTRRVRPVSVTQSVVPSLKAQGGDEPSLHPNAGEIDRAITAFARSDNGGLIVTSSGLANGECSSRSDHWRLRRAPTAAVYRNRAFATAGGLILYGADSIEPHRLAAAYLDAFSRARGQRAFVCRRRQDTSSHQSQDRESARPRCAAAIAEPPDPLAHLL